MVARAGEEGSNTPVSNKDRFQGHAATEAFPWTYFAVTYAFTWLICLPGVLSAQGMLTLPFPRALLIPIAQFGPSFSAFLLVYRKEGKLGVKQLLKRVLNFRIPIRWLIPTLLLPLILAASALYLHFVDGGQLPPLPLLSQPVAILPTFLFIFLLQGPVPEEFGWRGYALDRLQVKWNALVSSLVLGLIWGVWHLPLFYMGYLSFLPLLPYLVLVIAYTILMTWLYNNTGRNLLVAMLFHGMINLGIQLFPPVVMSDQSGFIYLTILYVIAAALVVVIWGPRKMRRMRIEDASVFRSTNRSTSAIGHLLQNQERL